MTVKYLLGSGSRVGDGPMVNGRLGNHSNSRVGDPFPEYDILITDMRLHFLFRLNVEDLECSASYVEISATLSRRDTTCYEETSRPLRAKIFCLGFIMALSAVIGRRKMLLASERSIITT